MSGKKDERQFLLGIIQLYRDLPVLWQVKSKEYSDRQKKNSAYEVLVKKYNEKYPGATRDDVRKKINSLRTNFRKELAKMRSLQMSGAGSDEIYQPTLWYFDEMRFLVDQEMHSQSTSVIGIEEDENGEDFKETSVDASTSAKFITRTPPKKKTKMDQREELLTSASKRLRNPNYEYAKLASAWVVELQKMNPTQMLFAKKAINDILFEGQMGTLHRHSVVINAPMSRTSTPEKTGDSSPTPDGKTSQDSETDEDSQVTDNPEDFIKRESSSSDSEELHSVSVKGKCMKSEGNVDEYVVSKDWEFVEVKEEPNIFRNKFYEEEGRTLGQGLGTRHLEELDQLLPHHFQLVLPGIDSKNETVTETDSIYSHY
ncbi:uncharacterized protein LOC143035331 isoform X4 [Oratosquilla oratoria]|uniref:uncharacterized protein LOC143035331 isoform X4 n=1 Tax=Oratosquilla oratoria TaxID=337810 RepID=UPI003F766289